jgi:GntP family gluconate:H+ symporter
MITGISLLADDAPKLTEPVASGLQLVLAFIAGIAVIVVLITVVKLHPFLSLLFGALTVGIVADENIQTVLTSFAKGFGDTAAGVGILIALGAMFAKLLADSGGADEIVDTIVGHASPRMLPWAMALVGAIIGLPMFFEIGLVLLIPVIYLVSRRSQLSLITVGIPALAGLSAMHGFACWWRCRRSSWPALCSGSWPGAGWWSRHPTPSTPIASPMTVSAAGRRSP